MVEPKETITKEKITEGLKSNLGLSAVVCEEIVNQFFNNIYEIINTDKRLTLRNFGCFSIKTKKARPGINFRTKEKVIISERKVVRFTPAENFKALVNKDAK